MSYLVLARKYRPKNFAELVGQEHVVQALANALKSGRLHHAYLFTGTRGVGKTTVSRILAKSLNCRGADGQGGVTDTPCGVCEPCRDIDRGRFVDYTELDAASNRGVDEVQSLLEQAVYKPVQGRFKVFMIDEVHMLSGHAFNAMLKTLEEPPEYLKFVLATTDPQKVPVTVLSRCLQFNLRPMAPQTVSAHLGQVLASENVLAEPAALRLIARAARGSMRDALSLTDQAIAFGGGELREAPVRQLLGSVDRSHVLRLIEALAAGDARSVIDTVGTLRKHGFSSAATLEDMSLLLQRMAVLQAVPALAGSKAQASDPGDEDEDAQSDPEAADAARLAVRMPADETQLLYSICVHGRAELGLAPDEYAGLTMVLLRLLAFKPQIKADVPVAEKKTLSELPKAQNLSASSWPSPAPVPAPADEPTSRSVEVAGLPALQPTPEPPQPMDDAAPALTPSTDTFDTQASVSSVQDSATPVVEMVAAPDPVGSAEPAHESVTAHDDFWHLAVQRLAAGGAITALVRELALQSQLIARDDLHWTLRVESASLDQPVSRERLAQALAADGHQVTLLRIEIAAVSDSPARRITAVAERAQQQALAQIESDPFVQSMMRDYGARIVPGSVRAQAAPQRGG